MGTFLLENGPPGRLRTLPHKSRGEYKLKLKEKKRSKKYHLLLLILILIEIPNLGLNADGGALCHVLHVSKVVGV